MVVQIQFQSRVEVILVLDQPVMLMVEGLFKQLPQQVLVMVTFGMILVVVLLVIILRQELSFTMLHLLLLLDT